MHEQDRSSSLALDVWRLGRAVVGIYNGPNSRGVPMTKPSLQPPPPPRRPSDRLWLLRPVRSAGQTATSKREKPPRARNGARTIVIVDHCRTVIRLSTIVDIPGCGDISRRASGCRHLHRFRSRRCATTSSDRETHNDCYDDWKIRVKNAYWTSPACSRNTCVEARAGPAALIKICRLKRREKRKMSIYLTN